MRLKNVVNLSPVDRFLYWIKERHNIYLCRKAGKPKPWTDDEVLQSYFFTNPYREHDKTTVWFRENVRDVLQDKPEVLMATVIFRWFNLIKTGEMLVDKGLLENWRPKIAIRRLQTLHKDGPVFTGAYMIKAGNGPPGCKIPNVCDAISNVWKERKRLVQVCLDDCRLEALWSELKQFAHLGRFMSYEIVCDLRHTYLLERADDINTWTNLGPGAARGLQRINDQPIKVARTGMKDTRPKPPGNWMMQMRSLLSTMQKRLRKMPQFELREVEHSLCEFDKYERMRLDQGKSKRKFKGVL